MRLDNLSSQALITKSKTKSTTEMPMKRGRCQSAGDVTAYDIDFVASSDSTSRMKKKKLDDKRNETGEAAASVSETTDSSTASQQELYDDVFKSVLSQSLNASACAASATASMPTSDVAKLKEDTDALHLAVKKLKCSLNESVAQVEKRLGGLTTEQRHQQKELAAARAEFSSLTCEVHELSNMARQQQEKMSTLAMQVSFILSFLGITAATAAKKNEDDDDEPAERSAGAGQERLVASNKSPPVTLKHVMRQTIQQDGRMKAKRAKTIIVSGLEPTSELSDQDAISKLLRVELDARPQVIYCKRLGQPKQGRVQPLLVAMAKQEDAAWIIANAKKLRDSRVRAIRDNVYINANLSKEQAQDAYQQRLKRRTAAQQRGYPESDSQSAKQPRGPRIVHNSKTAGTAGRSTDGVERSNQQRQASQLPRNNASSGQSPIKLVYRPQKPTPSSQAGTTSSSSAESEMSSVVAMDCAASDVVSSDQPQHHITSITETDIRRQRPTMSMSFADGHATAGHPVSAESMPSCQQQQQPVTMTATAPSSMLNPTAAVFVVDRDGDTAGSCANTA